METVRIGRVSSVAGNGAASAPARPKATLLATPKAALAAALLATLLVTGGGCGGSRPHPAVGRVVMALPVESVDDPDRPSPELPGHVTLLTFWGTWCPPCRRELPALARIASRLADDRRFQLVAVSCGSGGPDDRGEIVAETTRFLERERIAIGAWCDPSGIARMLFADGFGFEAFPTTYLVGPDGRVRRVWTGSRARDEAEIATAVVDALKACPAPTPSDPAARETGSPSPQDPARR